MTATLAQIAIVLETTEKNVLARAKGLKLLPKCGRCLGTGHYSFNGSHSNCYGCNGAGQSVPKSGDFDEILADAEACKTDGRFAAYMLYLEATRATKNAVDQVMKAWTGSGISAAYDWRKAVQSAHNPSFCQRDRDISDINKKMADAYTTVSKVFLSSKSPTYQADVIAFAATVKAALETVAAADAEFKAYMEKNPA